MAAKADLTAGTITLTNGSADFTGTGTSWLLSDVREGDTIIDVSGATEYMGVVLSISSNTAGTLTKAWEGPTVTAAYRLRYMADGQRSTAQARNLIELLGNGNLTAFAGVSGSADQVLIFTGPGAVTTVPKTDLTSGANYDVQVADLAARAAYDAQLTGYAVLVSDVGDGRSAIYSKNSDTSADWSSPAYVTGPIGPLPEVTVGTVTTGAPGTSVIVTPTPTIAGVELDFTIPSGRGPVSTGDYSAGTAYVLDDAVLYNGSTWIALGATTGNAPPTLPTTSNAYWQLLARQGIDGAGTVNSVVAGDGISVDYTDPTAPVVSADIFATSVETSAYTILAADFARTIIGNNASAMTFSLTAAATLGADWFVIIKNEGAGVLTIDPNGSETIDGAASVALSTGASMVVLCSGSSFRSVLAGGASRTGSIVQTSAATPYVANAALTAVIPNDDTIPQNTEGTEILSATITPTSATSKIRCMFTGAATTTGVYLGIAAMFKDSDAGAFSTTYAVPPTANYEFNLAMVAEFIAGGTGAITVKVRAGPNTGTMYFNGNSGTRFFGGTMAASLILQEIAS